MSLSFIANENNKPLSGDRCTRRSFVRASAAALAGVAFSDAWTGSALYGAMEEYDHASSTGIAPFHLAVKESVLQDLRHRLSATRWPEPETVGDWSQGVPLASIRAFVEYWRTQYNWRRCEALLNHLGQFKTKIDGLNFHFLHVRSKHKDALPLLLTHGWPGSVIEFYKTIGPLTDPTAHGGRGEDAFHIVAPSLPGFAFSEKPKAKGWNAKRVARAWVELMSRLGYTRYVAQGGDWGATITTRLAQLQTPHLAGIHLNWPLVFPENIPAEGLTADEKRAVASANDFMSNRSGFFKIQATRPQTIAYGLTDSPVGQAAWIYEKFQGRTGNQESPESFFSRDELLDNIMLYWLTDTAGSSARFYWENANEGFSGGTVDVPVGCSIFPGEIYQAPRSWAERMYTNLIYWNELDRGGHFAALELPQIFAAELRACFRGLRRAA